MAWLPYHHDWRLAYQTTIGIRLHWFGRYAGTPDWKVETSRLAADMVSFFFVERNSCWAVVNGRRWTLQPGDLLVVLGGDEFSLGHNPARPHVSLSAALAFEQGGRPNTLLFRKFQRRYVWRDSADYVAQFEIVHRALGSTSPCRDLEIAGALLRWLAFILNHTRPPMGAAFAEVRSTVDKVLAAETWASARLQETITLAEWAKAVGLHPVYFGRAFKRETGLRPMEWLNQQRLQVACQHLAGTTLSVTQIADACGFSNPFYFSRVFRRHFGQSPIRYRKTQF